MKLMIVLTFLLIVFGFEHPARGGDEAGGTEYYCSAYCGYVENNQGRGYLLYRYPSQGLDPATVVKASATGRKLDATFDRTLEFCAKALAELLPPQPYVYRTAILKDSTTLTSFISLTAIQACMKL